MNVLINKNDKILVVAPHADDESIGCGGLLSLYGNQADLLLITDGSKGYTTHTYSNENDLVQIRSIEFNNAAKLANVKSVFYCNIVDGTVKKSKIKFINLILKIIIIFLYQIDMRVIQITMCFLHILNL